MADTPEELTKKLAEILENGLFPKVRSLTDAISSLNNATQRAVSVERSGLNAKRRGIDEQQILQNRQAQMSKAYGREVDAILKAAKQGTITQAESQQNIIALRDKTAAALATPELQMAFEKQANSIERNAQANNKVTSEFTQAVSTNLTGAVKAFSSSLGSVMREYQSGSSQLGTGAVALQSAVSMTGGAFQTAGAAASAAGAGMSMASNSYAKGIGIILQGIGLGASLFGKGLSETATKVLPFLQTELENGIANFQSLSNSGALFSDGLTGMIRTAGEGRLTLSQFNNIVKNNTEALASMGGGVSAGSKRLTQTLGAGGESFRINLLKLGYSIEEQGDIVAATALEMTRAGRDMSKVAPKELADQSEKYATSLRVIADITGQDAKKLRDKANAELQQVAVRATMQEKMRAGDAGVTERFRTLQMLAGDAGGIFNDISRQILGQGQITNAETGRFIATIGPAGQQIVDTFQRIRNDSTLTGEQSATLFADAMKKFNQAATGPEMAGMLKAFGASADLGGPLSALAKQYGESIAATDKYTQSLDPKKITENVEGQKNTTDKLTDNTAKAVNAVQNLNLAIQESILDSNVMGYFAEKVEETSGFLVATITKMKRELGLDKPKTSEDKTKDKTDAEKAKDKEEFGKTGKEAGSAIGSAILGTIGMKLGAVLGSVVPVAGTVAGGVAGGAALGYVGNVLGGIIGEYIGEKQADPTKVDPALSTMGGIPGIPEMKKGGIIDGPSTGTLAMLHGREMVMPLPANFDISELTKKANDQITATGSIIDPQLAQMMAMFGDDLKTSTNAQKISQDTDQQIAALMQSLNAKFDDMIDHMRDVVANTDRTARGVA